MKRLMIMGGLLLVLFAAAGGLLAQLPTGRIIGRVVDDQGNPLPGVSVEATSPQLVGRATAVTDETGTFRLNALAPGTYTVNFTLQGFAPITRQGVRVRVEETITLDIAMTPGKVEEAITVTGQSPIIDVRSTTKGATLTRDVFTALPRGRNFDSLITTVPGVQNEPLLAGISVDGASGAENVFYVDGTNTTQLVTGTSGQQVNFDFAEEIQFKASGYNAEFGGSVGGVVNVITRSGGNEFHGDVIGYFYGTALEGTRRKELDFNFQDYSQAQYYPYNTYYGKTRDTTFEVGGDLGGYVLKDRVWFYGSVLPRFFTRNRTVDYAIQGIDAVIPYKRTEGAWNASAKVTAQPFGALRIGASVVNNFSRYLGENVDAATGNPATNYGQYGYWYPNFSVNGYADWTLSRSFLASGRVGWFRNNTTHQAAPVAPSPYYAFMAEQPYGYLPTTNAEMPGIPAQFVHPAGWQNFPRASVMQTAREVDQRLFSALDLTYFVNLAGEHAWKAGVQYVRRGQNYDNTAKQPIVYLDWNQDFVAYGVNYGRGAFGWYGVRGNAATGPYGDFYTAYSNLWALYLQDSWTLMNRLTLNLGVRTESEYLPNYSTNPLFANLKKPVNFPFGRKIAPRLGFIYDVLGNSSLKFFGSFGIYHDVMKLYMAANALGGFKWQSAFYTLDTPDFTTIGVDGNYPGTLLTVLDFRPPMFDSIDPSMKPFTQREISVGGEALLLPNVSLSVRGVNKSILWAIEDLGVVLPGIGEFYYYSNPGGAFINEKYAESRAAGILPANTPNMPKAKRDYWGLNLMIEKRLSNNWFGGLSYTLSTLRGNYGGLASSDELGRNDPNGERYFDMWFLAFDKNLDPIDGVLPTDRPHVIKAYGSYVFPFGLTVGTIINAMSGTPVTQEWNVDSPAYYPFNRGNLGRTPFLWFTNLYAEYNFRLRGRFGVNVSLNVDNVFNVSTAQRIFQTQFVDNISPGNEALVSKNWEVPPGTTPDPRYLMPYAFYPPINARVGVRLTF